MMSDRPDAEGIALLSAVLPDLPAVAIRWLTRQLALGRRLEHIPGVTAEQTRQVLGTVERGVERPRILNGLVAAGFSPASASRLYIRLGVDAGVLTQENPYLLASLPGIDFAELDRVAAGRGWPPDCMERMRGAARLVMAQITQGKGHTGVSRKVLLRDTLRVLRSTQAWGPQAPPVPEGRVEEAVDDPGIDLIHLSLVHRETGFLLRRGGQVIASTNHDVFWNAPIYWSEIQAADRIQALLRTGESTQIGADDPQLGQDQRRAVEAFWRFPVLVVTGSPGTGKTFLARAILDSIRRHRPRWRTLLAAPTGMAAQRLASECDQPASTIHRLLAMGKSGRSPYTWNRRPLQADALLIDEASMLDIFLFRDLTWAAAAGTRLVLIGDANQLPPVGPGAVLRDLIAGGVPCVTLNEVRRQGPGSAIPRVAAGVLQGNIEPDGADVVLAPGETIWQLDPTAVQILTAYRDASKNRYATEWLNEKLQDNLNPGAGMFRAGDPVVQTRNLHLEGGEWIPNGERGWLHDVETDRSTGETTAVTVEYPGLGLRRRLYGLDVFRYLELAYAVTVHKAQGSEYDQVAIMVGDGGRFWERRLLYTALTRARSKVWLLGSEDAVREIAARKPKGRRTLLQRRLARRLTG